MGEKKKFDNRIIIGIAVAAAIVGVVIYAVFGGKGDKENGLSSLYSEPAQSVVSAEQSEISEQISEQPLEQSQVESEAIMSQPDAAQTTIPQTTKPQNNGQDGQYSNTYSKAPSYQDEPQQAKPAEFSLSNDIINALKKTKTDLFGSHVPQKEWAYRKYGATYRVNQFSYNFYDDDRNDQPPVSINVSYNDLFSDRTSRYTSSELMQKLGKFYVDEYSNDFGYYWRAKWQGYGLVFSGTDSSNLFAVTVYNPEYTDF